MEGFRRGGVSARGHSAFQQHGRRRLQGGLGKFRPALNAADRIEEVQLARELGEQFRAQYRAAEQLAKAGQ